ncbi:MAG: NAD(+) diphosphatase [Clostridiales bacterium]|nr:NAD(+) diphosphatase [Clostridiales bacterium]
MIQDIGNHKVDITFDVEATLKEEDYIVAFDHEKNVYLRRMPSEDEHRFLHCEELLSREYRTEAFKILKKDAIYLMRIEGRALFLLPDKYFRSQPDVQARNISVFRDGDSRLVDYAMITAWHFYTWYEKTKFCGACGIRLRHAKRERAMVCPICGNVIYPRIFPAIIVGVYHEDSLLLTKRHPDNLYYALVSGYCETGETIEETVCREVMEETGVRVKNLRYYKSQPWGLSQSLLSGFYAKLDGDADIHLYDHELSMAKWVKREDLDGCYSQNGISLTAEMIEYFKEHAEEF